MLFVLVLIKFIVKMVLIVMLRLELWEYLERVLRIESWGLEVDMRFKVKGIDLWMIGLL